MQQIKNNAYRVIGLLVGATAPQQVRQINRLRQSIEAEVEPDEDFSFPVISKLQRTTETVNYQTADPKATTASVFLFLLTAHF